MFLVSPSSRRAIVAFLPPSSPQRPSPKSKLQTFSSGKTGPARSSSASGLGNHHWQSFDRRRQRAGRQPGRGHRQDFWRHQHHRAGRGEESHPGPARDCRAGRPAHRGGYRGSLRHSYTCAPTCSPAPVVGDAQEFFDDTMKAAQAKAGASVPGSDAQQQSE